MECKEECRNSGPENQEKRKKVIINKRKLKDDDIFIENDLSWEERKMQEKMDKWIREKRKEEVKIKIGRGRMRMAIIWRAWKEIEREKMKRAEGWRDEERERGGREEERSLENRDRESVRKRKAIKYFV